MNIARCALCTVFVVASLATVTTWSHAASAQDRGQGTPKPADGNYVATDPDGNYQKALDAAIAKAQSALSNGGRVADLKFNWTIVSVSGTSGGITGKHDVSVMVHATM